MTRRRTTVGHARLTLRPRRAVRELHVARAEVLAHAVELFVLAGTLVLAVELWWRS